jgi:ATP-dependent DNA helicase RecG
LILAELLVKLDEQVLALEVQAQIPGLRVVRPLQFAAEVIRLDHLLERPKALGANRLLKAGEPPVHQSFDPGTVTSISKLALLVERGEPFVEPVGHVGKVEVDEGVGQLMHQCAAPGADIHHERATLGFVVAVDGDALVSEQLFGVLVIASLFGIEQNRNWLRRGRAEIAVSHRFRGRMNGAAVPALDIVLAHIASDDKRRMDDNLGLVAGLLFELACRIAAEAVQPIRAPTFVSPRFPLGRRRGAGQTRKRKHMIAGGLRCIVRAKRFRQGPRNGQDRQRAENQNVPPNACHILEPIPGCGTAQAKRKTRYNANMSSASDQTEQVRKLDLSTPIQFLKGCGPERAQLLVKLEIRTVRDLLFFFPRDYQDLTELHSLEQFEEGKLLHVLGTVAEVDSRMSSSGKLMVGVLVQQGPGFLRAMWFNQPFMAGRFKVGQSILLTGKAKMNGGRWEMVQPKAKSLETEQDMPASQLLPIYSLTEGLSQHHVRRLVQTALSEFTGTLEEVFPQEYLVNHQLLPLQEALPKLHFPTSKSELEQAQRRFVYQELFVLQLALAVRRHANIVGIAAKPLPTSAKIDARIRRLFPFDLTAGQVQAIAEITADMGRVQPMNRLLQGDVGSGKTAVAVYAMLLAIAHGTQAALMAPTEILARQHNETLSRLLSESQVKVGLLVGGMRERERADLLATIASGETAIVVGTQAFVQSDVQFAELGLVVIDEQHKFGVKQRAMLKRSAAAPHYLVMTATPIPRSVGMTLYGDLDLTTLRELPPGRQAVHTYLPSVEEQPRWWEFFRKKLREGRQGYVVTPLVEGSEAVQAASLEETFESLTNDELAEFRLGLIHGRMTSEEKDAAMERFRRGDTQVLCATSVVEVGVDIPNATVMSILNAERFGLAQLHQLRGRIGRGTYPGFCCLFADPQTPESKERLEAFVKTTDGFELAEIDFKLRGPGDLFGTRQHGLPPMYIADLGRDESILEEARRDAQGLINEDPGLSQPEHVLLRRKVLARYGQALDLGDVG